jgi:hypothetical protein
MERMMRGLWVATARGVLAEEAEDARAHTQPARTLHDGGLLPMGTVAMTMTTTRAARMMMMMAWTRIQ